MQPTFSGSFQVLSEQMNCFTTIDNILRYFKNL
jgi:hypothetical protein